MGADKNEMLCNTTITIDISIFGEYKSESKMHTGHLGEDE